MKSMFYLVLCVVLFSSVILAQIPNTLGYQGVLKDASGVIVPDGDYIITFSLYTEPAAGSPIWYEVQAVNIKNGIFNVTLGSTEPIDQDFNTPYWVGIKIGTGTELTPRTLLTTSPYSFRSKNSEMVNGYEASETPGPLTLLPLNSAGRYPKSVLPAIGIDGVEGSGTINISSTSPVQLLSLPVNTAGTKDILINATLVVETSANQLSKRYEFSIRRNSVNGDYIHPKGWWRVTGTSDIQYVSETITFSVVDKDVTGNVTYYLVARKFDSNASDAIAFIYGLNVIYVEH